jgi:hypothetical protein
MSIRGLWIFTSRDRKKGKVFFSRRFITVEKRQRMAEEKTKNSYFPLPGDVDLLKAVVKVCCSDEDRFVEERDSCSNACVPPTYELFDGKLWPVVWLMKDGYIYVTVPLAEPTPEGNRKPLVEL